MLLPNWTGWKTVKLTLFLLTTMVGAVATAQLPADAPASILTYSHYAQTVLGILGSIVVVMSGSSMGPVVLAKMVKPLAVLVLFVGINVGLIACLRMVTPAQQASDFATAADCVMSHWGEPVGQIAAECLNSEIPAAEDVIADIEWIIEQGQAPEGGVLVVEAGTLVDPYAHNANVQAKLAARRAGAKVHP